MGGGNDPASLVAYAEACREVWPDMTVGELQDSIKHGLEKVKFYGKMNFMALSEFVRRKKAYDMAVRMRPEYRPEGWESL